MSEHLEHAAGLALILSLPAFLLWAVGYAVVELVRGPR